MKNITEMNKPRADGRSVTDDELYRAYLSGDVSAIDTLALKYRERLTAYLAAIVHKADDAEDLAMETFARLMAKRPGIRAGGFRAYLYRMARNLALRFIHRSRILEFTPEEIDLPDSGNLESGVADDEARRILRRCLERVEPEAREALWLIYFEDMSYTQAAEVMHMSTKKLEYRISKGKRLLKEELEKEGITDAYR